MECLKLDRAKFLKYKPPHLKFPPMKAILQVTELRCNPQWFTSVQPMFESFINTLHASVQMKQMVALILLVTAQQDVFKARELMSKWYELKHTNKDFKHAVSWAVKQPHRKQAAPATPKKPRASATHTKQVKAVVMVKEEEEEDKKETQWGNKDMCDGGFQFDSQLNMDCCMLLLCWRQLHQKCLDTPS
jgi:hypothetical protein